jgi:hypothetical protein
VGSATTQTLENIIPPQYCKHAQVFSDKELKKFPLPQLWDHAIDLKLGAPATLISQNICLFQPEQEELKKFLKEHEE